MKKVALYISGPENWTIPQLLVEIEQLIAEINLNWNSFYASSLESSMMLGHIASILTLKLHEELAKAKLESYQKTTKGR